MEDNRYVIFGAGKLGKRAIDKYGKNNILFFIDNNEHIIGNQRYGIEIKAVDSVSQMSDDIVVIIASRYWRGMERQLREMNIKNYEIYGVNSYIDSPELIINPYIEKYESTDSRIIVDEIQDEVERLQNNVQLFNHIEIETINRCNGKCSFCPVNVYSDNRELKKMSKELFEKIIHELEKLDYQGKIALFSNNEPLLDNRILDFHYYAREHLPNARMHLCTNGTLLTLDKYIKLMDCLDELIIDNYNQELEVIPSLQEIVDFCEDKPELKKRTSILLRKQDEVLTSRGGDAPNVEKSEKYPMVSCILPFQQMIIRPDGKVSLCCNDALGKTTLGDVTTQSVEEVWNSVLFKKIRFLISKGRENYDRCRYCDTLYIN